MTSDSSRHRLGLLAVTALSLFGALFARLWFLQVVDTETLSLQAEGNATRTVVTPAARGKILDRNGLVLVDNRTSIVVGVDVQEYDDLDEGVQTELLERLAVTLSIGRQPTEQTSVPELRTRLADERFSRLRPIPVAEDISPAEEIYFVEQADRYPSVVVDRTTVRSYPYGSLAAHVLGYTGALSDQQWAAFQDENHPDKPYIQTDSIGKAGVEATYEEHLRGRPGQRVYEVDRRGRVIRELVDRRIEPEAGDDVWLAIDARVQAETESALEEGLEARRATGGELGMYPAEAGAAAIIDPENGQVVAMASYPTYRPEDLVGGISCPTWRDLQGLAPEGECGDAMTREIRELTEQGTPPVAKLLNRAIQGSYPAASTFKLASAYAGLELGLITAQSRIDDPGYFVIPGCTGLPDDCRVSSPSAESGGVGPVDLKRALTVSSDTYFYRLGNDSWALHRQRDLVGPTAFQDHVKVLGYDARTGVDLPAESRGRIPDPAWLAELDETINGGPTDAGRWGSGNSINMSIGQGDVLVTPLQNANAYAAFANGGTLYEPRVVDRVVSALDPEAVVVDVPTEVIRTIDWGPARSEMMIGFEGVTRPVDVWSTAATAFEGFPNDSWSSAGKTGTAETGTKRQPKEDHSWFVGFGPSQAARYSAAVIMEHAGPGGSGAAPAVRRVFERIALGQLDQVDLAALGGLLAGVAGDDGLPVIEEGDG